MNAGIGYKIKEAAVGHRVGRWAQSVRQSWRILSSARECRGWHANDELAEYYVTRLCAPDRLFIDAGAHIGSITAAVVRHCPRAKVVAIEAIPEKAERLSRKFPSATILNCAIGEESGTFSFYIDLDDTAWSSLAKNGRNVREVKVRARTLDDLDLSGTVDVLKLDLEGAELGAMRGGAGLVDRDRPVIMFESGPTDYMGYTKDATYDWLTSRRYGIFLPARLGRPAPAMTRDVFLDAHEYPFATLNYFAVPQERTDEMAKRIENLAR